MLRERDNAIVHDKAIKRIVDVNRHFDGRDVSHYMEAYNKEMMSASQE